MSESVLPVGYWRLFHVGFRLTWYPTVNLDDVFPLFLGLNLQLMTVTVEILDKHALNLLKE